MNEWKTSACGGISTNVYHRRPRGLNVARRKQVAPSAGQRVLSNCRMHTIEKES